MGGGDESHSLAENRTPTRALVGQTLFEAVHGTKPNLAALVLFGVSVWVKIVDAGKLVSQAKLGHFVGYSSQTRGYCIYYMDQRKVSVEKEAVFDINDLPFGSTSIPIPSKPQFEEEKSKDILDAPNTHRIYAKDERGKKEPDDHIPVKSPSPTITPAPTSVIPNPPPAVPSPPPLTVSIDVPDLMGQGHQPRHPVGHYHATNKGKMLRKANTVFEDN